MIRRFKKIIHVSELKDGESAAIVKWNGYCDDAGVIVTRRGNKIFTATRLKYCHPPEGRFFGGDGDMIVFSDSSHRLFTLARIL